MMDKKISKHILVIRLSAMGDVAMAVPVLRSLMQTYPNLKITVLSRAFFKPFFEDIPNISFYVADVKGRHKGILGLYKLSKELKALQFDSIADLHNVLRSKILCFFFSLYGLKYKVIDKGRAEKKALTRRKNKVFKLLKSTHQRYADVFNELGFQVDLKKHLYPEKKELNPTILKILKLQNLKKTNLIGIAPFAQYESKMYPLALMEEVIKNLLKNSTNVILLFGGTKEKVLLEKLADKYKNVVSLVGKLNLKEELNVIAHLKVMLSMDSGNAHLAAMQGVPTVTVWGVTHPFTGFAPFNQPLSNCLTADRTQYPDIPCSVYGNNYSKGYLEAIKTINPTSIIEKLNDFIN